jgi:hypothetical protein
MMQDVREAVAEAPARPVWPLRGKVPVESAFSVLLVAEGFVESARGTFEALCRQLREELLATPPFGLLRHHPQRLALWSRFVASNQSGPALGTVPGDTVLRSTWDPSSQQLAIDEVALIQLLQRTTLKGVGGGSAWALDLADHRRLPNPGLVVVLVPASASDGSAVSGEIDANPDVSEDFNPYNISYVVTTVDPGWGQVVIRAIARGFGLGDEFSLGDAVHATPSAAELIRLDLFPNLVVDPRPSGNPPRGFKWFQDLNEAARQQPLTVVPFGGVSPRPTEQIQLFTGGGGYRSKVYRSAADCLMARQIGGGPASPRYESVPFCTVCDRLLRRAITGSGTNREETVTISTQRLEYDRAAVWEGVETITGGVRFPVTRSFGDRTSRPGPWWSYTVSAGPAIETSPPYGGLLVRDLGLMTDAATIEPLAERVEFRDVVVVLDDGSIVPFDYAAAFANTAAAPVLELVRDGTAGSGDSTYLRGVKLSLHSDLGGRCPVTLELSLVLKAEHLGIDPGHQVFAVKIYPQIGLTWSLGGPRKVRRFRACVRMVLDNTGPRPVQGTPPPPPETIASFFTDTNALGNGSRRLEVREDQTMTAVPLVAPVWTNIFDYHRPRLRQDTEVWAVYGPRAPGGRRNPRGAVTHWPPGTSYLFGAVKTLDQGAYDNIHLHRTMGADVGDPAGGPLVHAPGCAESCFHLHWRWGALAAGPLNDHFLDFYGWTRGIGEEPVAHRMPASPLIPPNQDLYVALTHPSTTRATALGSVVPGLGPTQAVVTSTTTLDDHRKALWYTVDITAPHADERQVLLEEGCSIAYRYNLDSKFLTGWLAWVRERLGLPETTPFHDLMHAAYSYIRWFKDAGGTTTSCQIPTGDHMPEVFGSTTLENL